MRDLARVGDANDQIFDAVENEGTRFPKKIVTPADEDFSARIFRFVSRCGPVIRTLEFFIAFERATPSKT